MAISFLPTSKQQTQQQEQMRSQGFSVGGNTQIQSQQQPNANGMTIAEMGQQAAASVDPQDVERADELNNFLKDVYLQGNDPEYFSQMHPELFSAFGEESLGELQEFYSKKINENGTLDVSYQEFSEEFPQLDLYFNNTKPVVQVGNKVVQEVRNVVGGSSEGMKRVVNAIPTILAYGLGEAAKAVGLEADKVNKFRDDYLEYIKGTSSAETIGADEDSLAFKGTREAVNIAGTSLMGGAIFGKAAALSKVGKAALRANPSMSGLVNMLDDLAAKSGRVGERAGKVLKNSAEGTLDLALYFPSAEGRMPNKQDLVTNGILSAVFPSLGMIGRGVKDLSGGLVKNVVARTSGLGKERVDTMLKQKGTKQFLETFKNNVSDIDVAKDFLGTIRGLKQKASTVFQRGFNDVEMRFAQLAPEAKQQLMQRGAQIKNQFALNFANLLQSSRVNISPIMQAINEGAEVTKDMIDEAFVNRASMSQESREKIVEGIKRLSQYNDYSPSGMDFLRKEIYSMFQGIDNDLYQGIKNLLGYEKGLAFNMDDLGITDLGIDSPTFREMMENLPVFGDDIANLNKKYSNETAFVNELETLFVPGGATPDKVKDGKFLDTILTRFNSVFKDNKPAQRQALESLKKITNKDFLAKIAGIKASEAAPSGMITNIIGAAGLLPFSFLAAGSKAAAATTVAPIVAMYLAFTPRAITNMASGLGLARSQIKKMQGQLGKVNAIFNKKAKEGGMSPARFKTLMYGELLDRINDALYGDQSNY